MEGASPGEVLVAVVVAFFVLQPPSPVIRKQEGLQILVFLIIFHGFFVLFVVFPVVFGYLDFLSPFFLLPGEGV